MLGMYGVTTRDAAQFVMTWSESRRDFSSDVKFRLDAIRHGLSAAYLAAAVA